MNFSCPQTFSDPVQQGSCPAIIKLTRRPREIKRKVMLAKRGTLRTEVPATPQHSLPLSFSLSIFSPPLTLGLLFIPHNLDINTLYEFSTVCIFKLKHKINIYSYGSTLTFISTKFTITKLLNTYILLKIFITFTTRKFH